MITIVDDFLTVTTSTQPIFLVINSMADHLIYTTTSFYCLKQCTLSPEKAALVNNIILSDAELISWIFKTRQHANRNFTHTEWSVHFPNEPYHASCPQFGLEP